MNKFVKKGDVSIMLIIIIIMLTILTTAAVAVAISTNRDTTTLTLGEQALMVAESGAENAILQILRDPAYTGDPSLSIGPGNATITVTGSTSKTITSKGVVDNMVRTIQVQTANTGGRITVASWKEL